jgi:hypothetical protein
MDMLVLTFCAEAGAASIKKMSTMIKVMTFFIKPSKSWAM